ncbi:MAG TPA: FAD-dependent oxidoreductase [Candidatus Sulfomarinibacteraceae bacterium]|nr:FAD-dependent oxidoreductase [Candidatus Sulfomarinibacteraceae bacterium]
MGSSAEVVICGAGIAGVSLAYQLACRHGLRRVVLVDERPPLTLTSDKSTEAYRNWWPGPDDAMIRLMNRSIDLLEELAVASDNRFAMNRRGYLYCTADPVRAQAYREQGLAAMAAGAGELRIHSGRESDPDYRPHAASGWRDQPGGADLILDDVLLGQAVPGLAGDVYAALHTRRCGWLSGQQLGMEQLERARESGLELVTGRVEAVEVVGGAVTEVRLAEPGGTRCIPTGRFVNAAGPMLQPVARLLGLELPVFSELHLKTSFEDHLGVVRRDAPLLIWEDPQVLDWPAAERAELAADPATRWLTETMPAGVHLRPEGRRHVIILWPYHAGPVAETFPLEIPEEYAEVCLRGMTRLLPGLAAYHERMPQPFVDGGYYTKTRENRPLACPLPVAGAFVHGALSGFGIMASSATAELAAAHVTGEALPEYAPAFHLDRYSDTAYLARLEAWGDGAQL